MLRPLGPADAQELMELFERNRVALERWTGFIPDDVEGVLEYLDLERAEAAAGLILVFGVFLREELVGAVQVTLDGSGTGGLGYWIGSDHGGRNLAFEAAGALARVVLGLGIVSDLEIRCHVDNLASRRVGERLGFRFGPRSGDHVTGRADRVTLAESLTEALTLDAIDGAGRPLLGRSAAGDATWGALRGALERRFEGRIPLDLHAVDAAGEPAVLFSAVVAGKNAVAPQELLEHNATLAVGAMCLVHDQYVLRHVTPLARLHLPTVLREVELLVDEARRLARRYTSDAAALASTFAE